ncbi:MAG TPA: hypothetical protein VLU41_04205 [Ideonella sp.]|nr:hypothetical protein [Ideonella sp.]
MGLKRAAPDQPPEQLRYARLLEGATRLGLLVLVASFLAYAFGWITPHVSLERLPQLWHLPVAHYRQATGAPAGWDWLALVHHGDVVTLLGIVVLAGCSVVCLAALVPLYLRRRDRPYLALALAQAGVLLLAASGLVGIGH